MSGMPVGMAGVAGSRVTQQYSRAGRGELHDIVEIFAELGRQISATGGTPFVAVTRVGSFEEALAEANAVVYGLTAGVFSREQAELDAFLDGIEAGVVYVNRRAGATTGCTSAVAASAAIASTR